MKTFNSILQFQKAFSTDEKCRKYLELQRWGGTPACPFCGSVNVCRFANGKIFKCREKECRKKFSVTVGTVYESSKIPLTKWFLAMYILTNHSKGISSLQLAKWIDVTQKTAWFINHRLRESIAEKAPQMLSGDIEIDETYIGGKRSNKHAWQREELIKKYGVTGFSEKMGVIGYLQRGGKVHAHKLDIANIHTLTPMIFSRIEKGSTIMTDGHGAYKRLAKKYKHVVVNHHQGEYVVGQYHTNTLEGFWSILKRQINGIHHFVSRKHINRYCNESAYRYNTRELAQDEKFADALQRCDGRLKYKDLIK